MQLQFEPESESNSPKFCLGLIFFLSLASLRRITEFA